MLVLCLCAFGAPCVLRCPRGTTRSPNFVCQGRGCFLVQPWALHAPIFRVPSQLAPKRLFGLQRVLQDTPTRKCSNAQDCSPFLCRFATGWVNQPGVWARRGSTIRQEYPNLRKAHQADLTLHTFPCWFPILSHVAPKGDAFDLVMPLISRFVKEQVGTCLLSFVWGDL